MDFPSAELKTATTPEAQKLYSDAVKNFKKLHSATLKQYQQIKARFRWFFAIGAIYFLWNAHNPQFAISIMILVMFTLNEIEDIYLWLYQRKIRKQYAHQYIKASGKITQVFTDEKKCDPSEIELEFYDLEHQSHKKKFNISYPNFLTLQAIETQPEDLIEQSVEICLTPDFALVLQIRAYHHNPDQLPILTHHFHKNPLWQHHENYLLHPSYFYPESTQSIHFIRDEYAGAFQLVFQGLEQSFQISSTSPSLEHIENYIFASYSDFFMKHDGLQPAESEYRKLKFSNEPMHIELWKNPTTPLSHQHIQASVKQKKKRAMLWMIPCLFMISLASWSVSPNTGIAALILVLCIYVIYFSYVSSQSEFYQRCIPQL